MPKVNFTTDKVSRVARVHIEEVERYNLTRAARFKVVRKRNIIGGWLLGLTVIGIYSYTLIAIKQEKFLDDLTVPEKVVDQ